MGKKYIIILIDGAADYRIAELGNRTPLQAAFKPAMDRLAENGETGMVKTIPEGMAPGSDTANLSILGYNPLNHSTGRSSLEAVSIGINLSENDTTYRCNLVTLSGDDIYENKKMVDYSAGEISTEEAGELIRYLAEKLNRKNLFFYPGVSYRHVIVYNDDKTPHPAHEGKILPDDIILTPPHDITGERIRKFLPYGAGSSILLELMKNSVSLLENHPVNVRRAASGRRPANSIWIWSKAKKPKLDSFSEKHGIDGAVISAVDLVKGIGICAGLEPVSVIGATGNINTNFEGKARAALDQLKKGKDFVFIHIEAPDECSHQGNAKCKLMAIDAIDKKVVRPIDEEMQKSGFEYRIMILPDHPTPVALKTHTSEPVPFLIFDSAGPVGKEMFKGYIKKETDITEGSINYGSFDEFQAQKSGILVDPGYMLMNLFLRQ